MESSGSGTFSLSRIIYFVLFLAIGISLYYFLPMGSFLKGDVTQNPPPRSVVLTVGGAQKTYVEVETGTLADACGALSPSMNPVGYVSDLAPEKIKELFGASHFNIPEGRAGFCLNHSELEPYSLKGIVTCRSGDTSGKFCSEYLKLAGPSPSGNGFEAQGFSGSFYFTCSAGNDLIPTDDLSNLSSKSTPPAPRWFSSAVGECFEP